MKHVTQPDIQAFFDEATSTITYLVSDPDTRKAAIIDPVLDYDPKAGHTSTASAEKVLAAVRDKGLEIEWILETHAHADHLSAAQFLQDQTGAKIAIGSNITKVQTMFREIFHATDLKPDGSDFDQRFADGEHFKIGNLDVETIYTPGHTPGCVSYKVGDNVFVGDTMFMPDYGTARADFPGGDARVLYRSIHKLLALPPETNLWMCHDYKAPGRDTHAWQTSVAEQRKSNIHVHEGVDEDAFVAMREKRDKKLGMPVLILPSIQVNMRAGHMPPPEDDGHTYLKIPVNRI